MDWLKDKKNQPIVAAIAITVVVVVGFCIYWFGFRNPAPPADASAQMPAQMPPGMTTPLPTPPGTTTPQGTVTPTAGATVPGTPPVPTAPTAGVTPVGKPGQARGAVGAQVASVRPMETWRGDPFQPIGYKPTHKVVTPQIRDFPFDRVFARDRRKPVGVDKRSEIQQPSRRMAGILLGDRVYAIIETNGAPQVVQPGDYTTDRLAVVEKIEPNRVVLKTVDKKPRYVTIRMAASPIVQTPTAPVSTGINYGPPPGMPPPGPPPGMPPRGAP